MEGVELFKAVMVGFFAFLITIGAVFAVVSSIAKQLMETSVHVHKFPVFLMFIVVLLGGWLTIYWGFSGLPAENTLEKQQMMMLYAYFFALVPSVALLFAASLYYLDVRSAAEKEKNDKGFQIFQDLFR